jgi:hypothetical protein
LLPKAAILYNFQEMVKGKISVMRFAVRLCQRGSAISNDVRFDEQQPHYQY